MQTASSAPLINRSSTRAIGTRLTAFNLNPMRNTFEEHTLSLNGELLLVSSPCSVFGLIYDIEPLVQ